MKRIIALNGSARKHGNSAAMLEAFLGGVSKTPGIETERVDLFDLDYKGCRGCHGCNLKMRKKIGCVQKDGATELLERMREADGIVFASPVFFWELTAQLRALLERYIFPGRLDHHQEIAAIYTMYQPESVSQRKFTPHAEAVTAEIYGFLGDVNMVEIIVNETQTWETGKAGPYNVSERVVAQNEAVHAIRWDGDLANAREAGEAFGARVSEQ